MLLMNRSAWWDPTLMLPSQTRPLPVTPSYPGDHRAIGHRTTEVGREPSREDFLEGKAIGVGQHASQGHRVGQVIGDGYGGTVGGGIPPCGRNVSDEQGSTSVGGEDSPARVGVAEEEAAGHLLFRRSRCGRRSSGDR